MASISILINDLNGYSSTDLTNKLQPNGAITDIDILGHSLRTYLAQVVNLGSSNIDLSISNVATVAASATITFSSIANNDTVTINGIVFTAKTSGATGNQFNLGATDTDAAANCAIAVNASATAGVVGIVSCSAASGVVTVTALPKGLIGNAISVAISAHGTIGGNAVTGADSVKRLGGGTGAQGSTVTSYTN